MSTLLLRLLNRLQPPGGWGPFVLTLTACLMPAASLIQSKVDVDLQALLVLTLLATIAGLLLARSRLSTRRAAALGALLGVTLTLIAVGRLLPPPSLLWTEAGYAFDWVRRWQQGVPGWPLPFSSTAGFLWQRLYELGIRLSWWSQTATAGGTAQDTIVLALLSAFLAWTFTLFATWQIYRRHSALVGLLPIGLAVTLAAFFSGRLATFYLIVYLFCTLWLIAICSLWTQLERWRKTGTDHPGDMGMELILTLAPGLVLLVLTAAFLPGFRLQPAVDAFWQVAERPWASVERLSEQLFGPIEGGFIGSGGSGTGGSLPRSHLLGAQPVATERIVLYVTTNDPAPPQPDLEEPEPVLPEIPRRYWRGATYDVYTGSGWDNSPLERRPVPPDGPLDPGAPAVSPSGQDGTPSPELVQSFRSFAPSGPWLYHANEPLRIDHSAETWWRGPGDLALLTSDTDRYTAISRPPEPSIADLRAAPSTVPPDVAERYLVLPDTIPQRVLDLTQQVVGDVGTQYDRTRAIEAFLRTYTYTLELPAPPDNRDIVDYFLFDLQQGYCDYYASAMVVMARMAGVPARLASGYAQGTYDHDRERWVVIEKDAHTWVEVYFDGIGWVEFEPTAGLPDLVRPGGEDLAQPAVPPLPPRVAGRSRFPWALLALGGVLALLLLTIVVVWFWRPHERRFASATDLVRDRHTRLLRWGARLGHPLRDGQTPSEYGTSLGDALQARGHDARWPQVRQASAEAPSEAAQLSEAYSRAQYSPDPVTDREGWQIRDLWTRLRRRLWWLWLARR